MNEKDIIDAWARIRTIDDTIPDDVLNFMKDSALEALNKSGDLRESLCNFRLYWYGNRDTATDINISTIDEYVELCK